MPGADRWYCVAPAATIVLGVLGAFFLPQAAALPTWATAGDGPEEPAQETYEAAAGAWQNVTGTRDGEWGSGTGPGYDEGRGAWNDAVGPAPFRWALGATAVALASLGLLACTGARPVGSATAWAWLPGYARLRRPGVLNQATRARVLRAVGDHPGLTFTELKRTLRLSTGALFHHLRVLEHYSAVRSRRDLGRRTFAKADVLLAETANLTPAQHRFLNVLGPGIALNRHELAHRLGLTPQAVSHHAKVLGARGLIRVDYDAGRLRCRRPAATSPMD